MRKFILVGPRGVKDRLTNIFKKKVNLKYYIKRKAFLRACSENDLEKVEKLSSQIGGLDWTLKNPVKKATLYPFEKVSPLVLAIEENHFKLFEFLLSKGANPLYQVENFTVGNIIYSGRYVCQYAPLMIAKKYPDDCLKFMQLLLEAGFEKSINHQYDFTYQSASVITPNFEKMTLLHEICLSDEGRLPIIELLIKYGADPFIQNKKGDTPCSAASPETQEMFLAVFDKKAFQVIIPSVNKAAHPRRPARL